MSPTSSRERRRILETACQSALALSLGSFPDNTGNHLQALPQGEVMLDQLNKFM